MGKPVHNVGMFLNAVPVKPERIKLIWEYTVLQDLRALAGLFKCEFIGNVCANGEPDCCYECAENHGYLKYILEENIAAYETAWDDELGFHGGEKDCRLPVELRSVMCLSHLCPAGKEKKGDLCKGLQALGTYMQELERGISETKVRVE